MAASASDSLPDTDADLDAELEKRERRTTWALRVFGVATAVMLVNSVTTVALDHAEGLEVAVLVVGALALLGGLVLAAVRYGDAFLELEMEQRAAGGPRDELQDQIVLRSLAVTGCLAIVLTGIGGAVLLVWDVDAPALALVLFSVLMATTVTFHVVGRRRL